MIWDDITRMHIYALEIIRYVFVLLFINIIFIKNKWYCNMSSKFNLLLLQITKRECSSIFVGLTSLQKQGSTIYFLVVIFIFFSDIREF